ncbi:hypothetical protein Glove_18g84 [Diversispora epigaea]|uniref:Uncharacterized protein n=1 Tax=Diversispora epigaea TaxID=1348612 RepID=A0A397JSY5_9GLOM|nr:hypothetical protein Glove_18g84 [Diversispora epigaea]
MSWKCDFCPQRIFTTKTSYTNHIKQCLKSVDSSEELSLENNFESIHENSNEDEGEGENEDEDNDSYNAEVEEESLTSDISHSSVSFFENMELSNSESENYSFNNYASDYNNICKEAKPIEFPNNAYADLMAFVTNYNLSNEATNAYKGEKAYSEQYTGNWWKNTEASLLHGSNLLSIILYSNATTTDTLGKSSLHPIYISIGNISTKRRNKSDAKQLLGYLPILKAKDKSEKKSKDFKKLVHLTFHNSMKFLLDPLFAEKGIDLEVDNKIFWFFPRISTIICDWPEAATFSLVYKSTNSNFPCHLCLISKTLLADTDLLDVTFRNNENMQEYFYNNAGQDVSLKNIPNYFWSLSSINVYSATVPDRMHYLDLGLFHYQIEFTQALLQKQDSSLVNKIDNRLSKIPRF